MKQSKKEERNRQKLAELFGMQEHLPTEPTPSQNIVADNKSREAEAVAAYLEKPKEFTKRTCKWSECGEIFAANRGNVAYCSDTCRQKFLASMGIIWDPTKDPRERWDYKVVMTDTGEMQLSEKTREPLTVPPPALVVADLALEFQAQQDIAVGQDAPAVSDVPSAPVVFEIQSSPNVYTL